MPVTLHADLTPAHGELMRFRFAVTGVGQGFADGETLLLAAHGRRQVRQRRHPNVNPPSYPSHPAEEAVGEHPARTTAVSTASPP